MIELIVIGVTGFFAIVVGTFLIVQVKSQKLPKVKEKELGGNIDGWGKIIEFRTKNPPNAVYAVRCVTCNYTYPKYQTWHQAVARAAWSNGTDRFLPAGAELSAQNMARAEWRVVQDAYFTVTNRPFESAAFLKKAVDWHYCQGETWIVSTDQS